MLPHPLVEWVECLLLAAKRGRQRRQWKWELLIIQYSPPSESFSLGCLHAKRLFSLNTLSLTIIIIIIFCSRSSQVMACYKCATLLLSCPHIVQGRAILRVSFMSFLNTTTTLYYIYTIKSNIKYIVFCLGYSDVLNVGQLDSIIIKHIWFISSFGTLHYRIKTRHYPFVNIMRLSPSSISG